MKTLTEDDRMSIADELYAEAASDLVGLWQIVGRVEDVSGHKKQMRKECLLITQDLLERGLLAGDPPYSRYGYQPWADQSPAAVLERIDAEWEALGHEPSIPDITWFARPDYDWT